MTTIKITELTDIGANLASSTVLPVVNMSGTPTTQKTVLGNIANVILGNAGGNYVAVGAATLAGTVTTNAQPNITSTGSLTGLTVSNAAGTVNFSNTANVTLGAVGNLHIAGGTAGQLLSTNGNGTLSWASDTTTYGNSNVVSLMASFGSNTITTTGNISVGNIIGNGQALTNIAGANVSGFVPNANVANTAFAVAAANVTGLGNIATINLTGSNTNVLYGNGVFAAVAGGANTGNVTFDDINIIGTGNLHLQPDPANSGSYLDIFLSSGPDLHLVASAAANLILGKDDGPNVMTSWDGNVYVQSWNTGSNTQGGVWNFGEDGNLQLPDTTNIIANNIVNLVANSTGNVSGLDAVGDADANLYAHANVTIVADSSNTTPTWTFDATGNLTVPGGGAVWTLGAGTSGLTANFADPYKVNLGLDYTTNTATLAGANSVVIQSNTGANTKQWTFGEDGILSVPRMAIGGSAGANAQGLDAVAVGIFAGNDTQGTYAVAVGTNAGKTNQGQESVAIGHDTGYSNQGAYATALGHNAATFAQGDFSVAVGHNAGYQDQGVNSVAIGYFAGAASQGNNSIILNATGAQLNQTVANTFTVKPVRGDSTANLIGAGFKGVYYNPTTGEFCYSTD